MKASTTEEAGEGQSLREGKLPPKVCEWRAKLSAKAKQQKRYRFYSLYGLISHGETLRGAWQQVRQKGGAAGVDGVRIEQIEKQGEQEWLEQLGEQLRKKSYRTEAVRRVYIPKANGKKRPLGIPTLKDRVVQTAVLLILEPIFEADFEDCSYGFRAGRNAHQALEKIKEQLQKGKSEIYDADLEGYFDSIPHEKLMACLRMRVVDRSVLGLIEQWLKAPIEEEGPGGGKRRRRNREGTPQGGVISALLANIYLHWFDKSFHNKEGPGQWANATLVRYADDFVVMARHVGKRIENYLESKLEGWLGLKLNRQKSKVLKLKEGKEGLEFLGYQIRKAANRKGKGSYWRMEPSAKAMERQKARIKEMTQKEQSHVAIPEIIERLNRNLRGWAQYYRLGQPRKSYRQMNNYVRRRLSQHLKRRSQRAWRAAANQSNYQHFKKMGLIYL
jgi:RNA-directed DNA polymerase